MKKAKYQVELDKYLDSYKEAYYLRIIGSKSCVRTNISQYITQTDGELREKLNYLYDNLDELYNFEMNSDQLKEILYKNIGDVSNFYKHLYTFLFESEDAINKMVKDDDIFEHSFKKMYRFFKKNFPNQSIEQKKLVKAYYKYIVASSIEDLIEKTEGHRDLYEDRLVRLYKSNQSKIEYASDTGIRLTQVNNTINRFLSDKNSKFYQMALKVSKRTDEAIINNLKALAEDIFMDESLDILYYFDNTRLCFQDFRTIIEPFFEKSSLRKILEKVNKLKTIENDVIKDNEIEATTIINGVEVSKEEKINIFKYMEYKNYPNGLYQTVLRKYVAGKLDIELELGKKLIKK